MSKESILRQSDFKLQLQRVLVVPCKKTRKSKSKSKHEIFILFFGYGSYISKGRDLIVIWDEAREKFDYLPTERTRQDLDSLKALRRNLSNISHETLGDLIDREMKSRKAVRDTHYHKRRPVLESPESIEFAIKFFHGIWDTYSPSSIDSNLKDKCQDNYHYHLLHTRHYGWYLNDFLGRYEDCWLLLMRDVFNEKVSLKSSIVPDPYGVVRRFLILIGCYPKRSGGSESRARHDRESEGQIVTILRGQKPNELSKQLVRTTIKEYDSTLEITPHLIQRYQELAKSSSYVPFQR